jgi:hypothetical protein
MGFSNGGDGAPRTYASIYLKKDEKPACFFGVKTKVGDKWQLTEEFRNLDNVRLVNIEHKEEEYEKKVFDVVEFTFEDFDGQYVIKARLNSPCMSIINSLSGIEDFTKPLKISLYVNKSGYPSSAIYQGEDMVKWNHSFDAIPKGVEVKKGKNTEWDFYDRDMFFINLVNEIRERLHTIEGGVVEVPVLDHDDDDLPF